MGRGVASMGICRRAGIASIVAAAAVVLAAGASAFGAADETPYWMLSDPVPANPAAFPWRLAAVAAGPVAAEVASSIWTVGDVAGFVSGLSAGGPPWGRLSLGDEETQRLTWVAAGGARVDVLAFQIAYRLMASGSGSLSSGFVQLMAEAAGGSIPSGSYPLDGTALRSQVWQDLTLRANTPLPVLPRLLGLRSLSVGAGLHLLSGVSYFGVTGSGTAGQADDPRLTFTRSSRAQGQALDVGLVAGLHRAISLEAAYLGAGGLEWTDVETAEVSGSSLLDAGKLQGEGVPWGAPTGDLSATLPAVALVGLHVRPLPLGLLELSAYYARVGVDRPESAFTRLQGEATFSALGLVRASLGVSQDLGADAEPLRVYGGLDAGIGANRVTIRASNLQELARGTQARALGLALMASVGL